MKVTTKRTIAPHGGSLLNRILEPLPSEFTRPEIAAILAEAYGPAAEEAYG